MLMYMLTQNNKEKLAHIMRFATITTHSYALYGIRYIGALFKMSNADLESNCLTVWWYTFKIETISSLCFVKLILENN